MLGKAGSVTWVSGGAASRGSLESSDWGVSQAHSEQVGREEGDRRCRVWVWTAVSFLDPKWQGHGELHPGSLIDSGCATPCYGGTGVWVWQAHLRLRKPPSHALRQGRPPPLAKTFLLVPGECWRAFSATVSGFPDLALLWAQVQTRDTGSGAGPA